jgi:hypothetical protein
MDPTICGLCGEAKLLTPEQQAHKVCPDCFHLPGFFKLPPSTRSLKACRECGGREFVRAVAFERGATGESWGAGSQPYVAPLAVAFRQTVRRKQKAFGVGAPVRAGIEPENVIAQVGWLELLICRACGLVTWHALEPHRIPIGPAFGTELVRADDESGPYR